MLRILESFILKKKKIFINNILVFYLISSAFAGFAYFMSSCGFFCGENFQFINFTNISVSSLFIASAVSVFMIPFVPVAIIIEYFRKYLSGFLIVPIAFVFVLTSYIDGQLFHSMGIHILDPVSIETVKSGNLFSLLQADSSMYKEFILTALVILTVLIVFFFIVIRSGEKLSRFVIVTAFLSVVLPTIFIIALFFIKSHSDSFPESVKNDLPGYELLHKGGKKNNLKAIELLYKPGDGDFPELKNKKNVLFIVVESLNTLIMDKELTPNINNFFDRPGVISSLNHVSSALYTEYSIFTLLYGLDNQYYRPFSGKKQFSYPLKLLRENGYRAVGVTASPLKSWRDHAKFLADKNFDVFKEYGGAESSDRDLVEYVMSDYSKNKEQPFFYFLFLNSTHHPYNFEKEFAKFKPYQSKDFSFLTQISDPEVKIAIKNRYLNSVNYVDYIFSQIIEIFKEEIENDRLAVVFTADHGEEFWEYGRLGHGKHFNKARYTVPFKISMPGIESRTVKLSGHVSIFPTLIDYLMPENIKPTENFMNGCSLLKESIGNSYFVTGSSTFPFHDNRIMITGTEGRILARKRGNSMDNGSFSVIEKKSPDGEELSPEKFSAVNSYLSDYLKNYMKFVKIKKKKKK